jgi:PAS domain S-box-containing protein
MTKCSGRAATLALAAALLLGAAAALADGPVRGGGGSKRRVLLLEDSDLFLPGSYQVDQTFRRAFVEGSDRPVQFLREWLDGEHPIDSEAEVDRVALLRGKYRRFSIDLVVAMDATSLEFAERHRAELWPGTSLVFCGVSETDARSRARSARTTGVALAEEVAGTVSLALALQPEARRLVIVEGTAESDSMLRARVRDSLDRFRGRLDVVYLPDTPMPALLESLRRLPPSAIVLYTIWRGHPSSNPNPGRDVIQRISAASAAPVYGLQESYLGEGIVGCVASSIEEHGQEAARIALRLLEGNKADSISLRVTTPAAHADWLQISRWNLDESRLPAGTDVRNVRPKLWQSHRRQVIVAGIGFGALTAAVLALLLWRAERRVSEDHLRKRLAFERLVSEISASIVDVSQDDVHAEVERSLGRVVESMNLERCALFVLRPGQSEASITHSAAALGVSALPKSIADDHIPHVAEALRRGTTVDVEAAASAARPVSTSASVIDDPEALLLLVPVSKAGEAVAGILFQAGSRAGSLPVDMVPRLRLVAQILFSAINRRRAEMLLRSSEEKYRTVVDSQTDLICRYLPDTTLTFVNEAYCRYFGLTREELIGKRFLDLMPESSRERARRHVQSLLENPRVEVDEHEVLCPDGTIGWQQWTDYAVFGRNGGIQEFQGIGRDVTDRKRVQEAEGRLAHASRLTVLGELATSIAHEIRQPLGAILSNTEAAEMLLESGEHDEARMTEVRAILSDIHREDLRASEVIQHVRSLMQHRAPETELLDVNGVARDVVRFVTPDARARRVRIELSLGESLPLVYGDQVQLQQVLLNLVVNAMEAMAGTPEPLRHLRIETSSDGNGEIILEVRDAGHGIAADMLPRLFQSFVTTRRDGLGLGLSLSRSIIESHGGTIRAENNPNRGATFRCSLPSGDGRAVSEVPGRIA